MFRSENPPVKQFNLLDEEIVNEKTALKVMVQYLTNAQRRGLFKFQESSKIWESFKCLESDSSESESITASPTFDVTKNVLEIDINNIQDALYVIIGFLNILQHRGIFTLDEASKILSCINVFKNK
jgi:hypothetical protein